MDQPFVTLSTNRFALDDFLRTHRGHVAQSELFELFCHVAGSLAAISDILQDQINLPKQESSADEIRP